MSKFFIFLLILLLSISFSTNAQPFLKYENPVWIKNNTAGTLTNVQVLVKFNTQGPIAAGWMQSDGRDIRFTSSCGFTGFLDYFIEGYINTDSTRIWVKVPSINANDSALVFLYYGNSVISAGSTFSVFDGPNSATDSVVVASTNNPSYGNQRGFRFTANEDVLVGYFGKRNPNATQRYVTLFDFATQAILAQIQVDAGTAGVYNYNALTTPVWLRAGQQYVLEVFQTGAADLYYYGVSTQSGQAFTYNDMRYCNTCTQNTFPTSIVSGQHYGIPDLLYYTKQNVNPAPTFNVGRAADTVTPAIPTFLTASPSNQTVTLRWRKNTEFDMYFYNVYRNTVNNPATATLVAAVLHPDTVSVQGSLINGTTYYFWVKAVDRYCTQRESGLTSVVTGTPTKIISENEIPKVFTLYQNIPNPFNPVTDIKFDIPKKAFVTLLIYDITGKEITKLVNEVKEPGSYLYKWDARELSSGTYFYKIIAGDFTNIKKMILLK